LLDRAQFCVKGLQTLRSLPEPLQAKQNRLGSKGKIGRLQKIIVSSDGKIMTFPFFLFSSKSTLALEPSA
jgi:hypothetical protein